MTIIEQTIGQTPGQVAVGDLRAGMRTAWRDPDAGEAHRCSGRPVIDSAAEAST
jgi:hypothetical protein